MRQMGQNDICEAGSGDAWYVRGSMSTQTWAVGTRYRLERVLGEGSFSCVCLATCKATGEKVALKRVGDVLASPDNAKRVLRECAILRRLRHPAICKLVDAFMTPSATGRLVYRGGQLVPASFDLYIALEYCNQGDLFHMRGQLVEADVKSVMWQLLGALRYMHSVHVWHRDIKSANILVTLEEGRRLVKLCDYGSARSAYHAPPPGTVGSLRPSCSLTQDPLPPLPCPHPPSSLTTQPPGPPPCGGWGGGGGGVAPSCWLPCSTGGVGGRQAGGGCLLLAPSQAKGGPGAGEGLQGPFTQAVCTPCYRAPEVIMSHGEYSSAMDMWSLGCVFGEVLQRVAYLGKSSTPHLQVAPVIAVTGQQVTPKAGERFEDGPSNPITRQELGALFAVVGTPTWGTVEAVVRHPAWHSYLRRLPGRASQLHRRFRQAGEAAVDLMYRLLEFDPSRRASAEEAATHEYFQDMKQEYPALARTESGDDTRMTDSSDGQPPTDQGSGVPQGGPRPPQPSLRPHHVTPPSLWHTSLPHSSLSQVLNPPSSSLPPRAAGQASFQLRPPCKRDHSQVQGEGGGLGGAAAGGVAAMGSDDPRGPGAGLGCEGGELMECEGERGGEEGGGGGGLATPPGQQQQQQQQQGGGGPAVARRDTPYHELRDPAQALAQLELELMAVCEDERQGVDRLREMLQRECDEVAAARKLSAARRQAEGAGGGADPVARAGAGGGYGRHLKLEGLQPDPGAGVDTSDFGKERLPHHADTELAGLLPEQHLRAGRHGEWAPLSLPDSQTRLAGHAGNWGVTISPPGMERTGVNAEELEGLMKAIRQQQWR